MIEKHELGNEYMMKVDAVSGLTSASQYMIANIVKFEDKVIKEKLVEYAKEYSEKNKKSINLILIDEQMAEQIVDLGIQAYIEKKK